MAFSFSNAIYKTTKENYKESNNSNLSHVNLHSNFACTFINLKKKRQQIVGKKNYGNA